MFPLLLLLMAADAECPGTGTLAELQTVLERAAHAAEARRVETFRVAQREVDSRLACLVEIVPPPTAAEVHALRALRFELDADAESALRAFQAAQAAAPDAPPPAWLGPPGTVIHSRWTAAERRAPSETAPVELPDPYQLYVDGQPATLRPTQRPALYQSVAPEGRVDWSAWLRGDEPLPTPRTPDAWAPDPAAAPPPDAPPQAAPPPAARSAEEALLEATGALRDGDYDRALEIAIPAVSTYPERAASFQAIADIAIAQLERRRSGATAAPPGAVPPGVTPPPGWGQQPDPSRAAPQRRGVEAGFDLGTTVGLRLEWRLGGGVVDGIGLRVGGGLMMYEAIYPYGIPQGQIYMDWQLPGQWQIESGLGFIGFDGYPYPIVSAALQWDPDSPLQINVGAGLVPYGFVPDVSVAFLW